MPVAPIPKFLTVDAHNALPDLPTAFLRWITLEEYPPESVLAEFVGTGADWHNNSSGYVVRACGPRSGVAEGHAPTKDEIDEWVTLTLVTEPRPKRAARSYFIMTTTGKVAGAESEPEEPKEKPRRGKK